MTPERSPYLTGGNAWLVALLVAVALGTTGVIAGPVHDAFEDRFSQTQELQGEIDRLSQLSADFQQVSEQERVAVEDFWTVFSSQLAVVRPNAIPDLVRELSRVVEEASAVPTAVYRSNATDGVDSLNLVSPDGKTSMVLIPTPLHVDIEADLFALRRILSTLAESGRPLQIKRVTVEGHGARVRAGVDLIYFVKERSA